ncbi:MAG: VWA domain-containing protein [Acidobacteriota bacterium]|nr:VWA domain-containing protein [Acidobacteriota bacterium]
MKKTLTTEKINNERLLALRIIRFPLSVIRFPLILFVLFFISSVGFAQNQCLSETEADKIIQTIKNSPKLKKNKNLESELLKMQNAQTDLNEKVLTNSGKNQQFVKELNKLSRQHLIRLCGILKENGWLRKETVDTEGLEAALFIIRNSNDVEIQREIFPVIVEATQKGFISKANLASLIDRIRIKSGGRQIFGTQIKIEDEVGFLYPLENEANVDKWRKIYELPTLSDFIKYIETEYRTIVVKMPPPPTLKNDKNTSKSSDNLLLGLSVDDDEVLNIESKLVNLNVRILDKDLNGTRGLNLKKEDFQVSENGEEQEISFFSNTDTPFDLVLLLDLSGSTLQKQGLIADSARRFIELARPKDRIAIVGFTDRVRIVSEFSSNKNELFAKLEAIDDYGSSKVWDALDFTYKKILAASQEKGRRSAVVFMTDGVDNTLLQNSIRINGRSSYNSMPPSKITFTELLETVRNNDANVFSIYLDTELSYLGRYANDKSYRQARRSLQMLAEESGGQYYRAGQIEELNGIYKKIVNELSEVYSLGYEPKDEKNDGSWRELKIKLKGKPDLIVKTKRGYYAN